MDIPTSNENYILGIGEVFQFVVESSDGSTISFNGYHTQCVWSSEGVNKFTIYNPRVLVHAVWGFAIMLLFLILCLNYQYVPKTFQKPEVLVSIDFPKVPITQFCLPLEYRNIKFKSFSSPGRFFNSAIVYYSLFYYSLFVQ